MRSVTEHDVHLSLPSMKYLNESHRVHHSAAPRLLNVRIKRPSLRRETSAAVFAARNTLLSSTAAKM